MSTQQSTENKKQDWLVTSPDDENFIKHLTSACYGNEDVARVLANMLYYAKYEADRQQLSKGCKVVKFTRKLDDTITSLRKLNFNISKKTLIRYFDLLNEWKYVGSKRYGRDFTVYVENVQKAINTPPAPPERKQYNRHPAESCKVVELQLSAGDTQDEIAFLRQKVEELQHFVVDLQLKVVTLQQNVDNLQLYNFQSASVGKRLEGQSSEPSIYINNKLSYYLEEKESVVGVSRNTALSQFSDLEQDLLITVFRDWINHRPEPQEETIPNLDSIRESVSQLSAMGVSTRYSEEPFHVEQLSTISTDVTQVLHTGASHDPSALSTDRQHPHLHRTASQPHPPDAHAQVSDEGQSGASRSQSQAHGSEGAIDDSRGNHPGTAGDSVRVGSLDVPAIENAPDNVAHTPTTVGSIAPHDGGDTTTSPLASYSPNGSTKPPLEEKKPKQSRRPPKTKIDAAMQTRIDHAVDFFNLLAREITGAADYCYAPSKKDIDAIVEWLGSNPTEVILREVYAEMWNTPIDQKTGFDWKKNMYIHSVLKQYSIRALSIKAKLAKRKQDEARKIVQHMSVLPPMPEEPELPCVFKSNAKHLRKVMGQ